MVCPVKVSIQSITQTKYVNLQINIFSHWKNTSTNKKNINTRNCPTKPNIELDCTHKYTQKRHRCYLFILSSKIFIK